MTPSELKARTKRFAVGVVKFVRTLPADPITREIGMQLVRSSGSVAANYRASCRSRSPAEFVAKLGIVEGRRTKVDCGSSFWSRTESFRERKSLPISTRQSS
jgi:hypothetical protein